MSQDPEARRGCVSSIAQYGLRLVESPDPQSALAAMEADIREGVLTELFVLRDVPYEQALSLVQTVRQHTVAKGARILVVDETLGREQAAELVKEGADECYAQPFLEAVYAAQVRGLLRRSGWKPTPPSSELKALGGRLTLDLETRKASVGGKPVNLSRIQSDLLVLLARSEGHAVRAEALVDAARGQLASFSPYDLEPELEGLRSRLGPVGESLRREGADGWTLG